ncbi:nuclear transport factor 2 family protein [Flavobacterium sp. ENC]|uniref:nuclear transport factor 2 family protein n=1 Tax=Flavobacterium sp. ENC TaxID=2897330 RepID=UPI001E4633F0|nr:nuclear transport factor 2 family protein [Flavobacterium sp. ENC]MCD0465996.1 nuclear transport factor 2 family protein [Flavobacterium sp. ENC]
MKTQIVELEKKYWQGMEDHNYETVKNLTRFPCIVAGKNGVHSVDEASFKKMFESGDGDKIKILNFSDIETQVIGENSAVIAYLIELGIEGDKQKAPMKCACTSTWIKEGEKWTCVLHTETELSKQ